MVSLLVLVQALDVIRCDVACPLHIEERVVAFDHDQARVFARVDDCVVNVRRIRDFERHEQVLDLVTAILSHPVSSPIEMHVVGVREESCWWPVRKYGLQEVHFLGMWLEDTVR